MGSLTWFWIVVIILALGAAAINFAIGSNHRDDRLVLAVRVAAGLASVAAAVFIVLGKVLDVMPTILTWPERILISGIFVFAVLFVPSAVERNREQTPEPTIRQRAARPTNATIRLRETSAGADEWVN
jgi:hypothetical protein